MPRTETRPNTFIVYRIRNLINGKAYIGQTSRALERRLREHVSKATHEPEHALHLAMRRHGVRNFDIEQVAIVTTAEEAYLMERQWIQREGTYGHGYNMTTGGETPDPELCRLFAEEIWQRPEFREKRRQNVIHKRRSKAASKAATEIWSRPEFREKRKELAANRRTALDPAGK